MTKTVQPHDRRKNGSDIVRKSILERDQREKVRIATVVIRDAILDQVGEQEKETAVFFPFSLNSEDDGIVKHILFENFRQKGADICFATPNGATIYIDRMTKKDVLILKKG